MAEIWARMRGVLKIDALPYGRREQCAVGVRKRFPAEGHAIQRECKKEALHDGAKRKQHNHLKENASRQRAEKAERRRHAHRLEVIPEPQPVH